MGDAADISVSTIIPCFDSARTIAAAIDSALGQTLDGVEVVVVDDGSSDETPGILAGYARRFPHRVRFLRQAHAGPYVARNLAARHSRGRYLAFLDSDDMWEPDKLRRQVRALEERPDAVLCHTGGRTMDSEGRLTGDYPAAPDYRGRCFERLLVCNRLTTSSVLVRRSAFEDVSGFDESFPARADWELWTRLALLGEFIALDEALLRYRYHEGRMSQDTDRMRAHHFRIIEKNRQVYRAVVPDLDRYIRLSCFQAHMAYGSEYLGGGRPGRARREALSAIRCSPADSRGWKLLIKSIVGPQVIDRLRGRDGAGGGGANALSAGTRADGPGTSNGGSASRPRGESRRPGTR